MAPWHEAQVPGGLALPDQLLEVLLDDGHLAPLQHGHLGGIGVAAGHPVAEMGERGRRGQADVADPDDGHRVDRPTGGWPNADSLVPAEPPWSPPCAKSIELNDIAGHVPSSWSSGAPGGALDRRREEHRPDIGSVLSESARATPVTRRVVRCNPATIPVVAPCERPDSSRTARRTGTPVDAPTARATVAPPDSAATSRPGRPPTGAGRQPGQPQGGVVEPGVGRAGGRDAGGSRSASGDRLHPLRVVAGGGQHGPGRTRTRWSRPGWSRGRCPGGGRRRAGRRPGPGRR